MNYRYSESHGSHCLNGGTAAKKHQSDRVLYPIQSHRIDAAKNAPRCIAAGDAASRRILTMDQAVIDRRYVCLKLIDLLYQKGLVNEATYRNIQVTYPRS